MCNYIHFNSCQHEMAGVKPETTEYSYPVRYIFIGF